MFPQILFVAENSKNNQESSFLWSTQSSEWTIFTYEEEGGKVF